MLVMCALISGAAEVATSDPAAAGQYPFAEYAVGSLPYYITAGPDGNLWFTEPNGRLIVKMTISGTFIEYAAPSTGSYAPFDITAGPDGNLWFTNWYASANPNPIGAVTTSGTFTEYPVSGGSIAATGITVGPDGNLWFAEAGSNKISKVTTGGAVTRFAVPTASSFPFDITAGPDGNVWFTEADGNKIAKVTINGTFTEYTIPTGRSSPRRITAGPDGNLWFTEYGKNKVGKVTINGTFTEYAIPTEKSGLLGITVGPDGNLWFTESEKNKIGKVTVSGDFTEYTVPTANSHPFDITVGPDGNLWFTEFAGGKIGQLNPLPAPTPTLANLDHFTCYKGGATRGSIAFAGISNPPGLSLTDQFGPAAVAVKKPKFLCTPTDKNNENPGAELHPEHLTGYPIRNLVKPIFPTNILVVDQFNPYGIHVDAKKQSHLLVPTVKDLATPPPTPVAFIVDHFQCYKVTITSGTPKFVAVLAEPIKDQFGVMTVNVKKPKYLCNPVDKNGEDPTAPTHTNHLMCYQVKQADPLKFAKKVGVFVNNQFGTETLDVKKPAQLCVPALANP